MMEALGLALYAACVDFLLRVALIGGVTYRDTNALLFFVLWPAVTVLLAGIAGVQRVRLIRRARGR